MDALLVWHEAQIGEDDETGEEAGETVDGSSDDAVSVRGHRRQEICHSEQVRIFKILSVKAVHVTSFRFWP